MLKAPKRPKELKADVRAALVLDAVQWRFDGVNTLQYSVTECKVGNWTLKPANDDVNVRTITVRLTPDVEFADLTKKKSVEKSQDTDVGSAKAESKKENENKNDNKNENENENENQNDEPHHLNNIELAYIHQPEMRSGDSTVVNVLDDDVDVNSEPLPFLQNNETMPTDKISNLKKINIQL